MLSLGIIAAHAALIYFFSTLQFGYGTERGHEQDAARTHVLDGFTVTAYCPGSCCNGPWTGQTSTGINLEVYQFLGIEVAAVDPAVIPLGSLLTFEGTTYLAADTGGLIKGRRIDICMHDHESTTQFGVKNDRRVTVRCPETADGICRIEETDPGRDRGAGIHSRFQ